MKTTLPINLRFSGKLAARPRAGFPVCSMMGVTLLFSLIGSGVAAEPEKISDSALRQIRALQQEKLSRSPIHRKLDSQFVFKLKQSRAQTIAQGVTKLQPDVKLQADGRVLVDIDARVTEALLSRIRESGGTVINSFPRFHAIRALVTLDQLETLAGSENVNFIHRARQARTNTGSVTSEGDITHAASLARSRFAVTGQGVKVGVLSDSVDYLANSQATGDLPAVTVLPGQSGMPGSGEGTAMLEIVHDLAPGAQLYFATAFGSEASFAQNILNLRSNGCDIIVDDVAYFNESPFQDGIIAQAVNTVTASGAMYFSAAGNDGNMKDKTSGTWEGDFADNGPAGPPVNIGGGTLHKFGPASYNKVLSSGLGFVELFWADPLGAASNDYDLFVLDPTGTNVVASSLNLQDGTQDPHEIASISEVGDRIVIVKAAGEARFLHLSVPRGTLTINTGGSIVGHSAAEAAFSVAAVDATISFPNPFSGGSLNPVETISSDGPRRVFFNANGTPITQGNFSSTGGVVRQKPDLAAADGVMTAVFGQVFGTSAAAPHAAAIAALLWSYDHTLTPSQIRTALTSTALDIEAPGIDSNSGAGIVMAYAALQSFPPKPVVIASGSVLLAESCPNDSLDPGETASVSLSLRNVGVANTTNLMATLLSTGGVTSPSGPQNYGFLSAKGGPTNRPFSLTATGNCGGMLTATLLLEDGTNKLGQATFTFQLGQQKAIFSENFDAVAPPRLPAGWRIALTGTGPAWHTISDISDTASNSIYAADPQSRSDNRLTSPAFYIASASAQLTFRHSYDVEEGYDGGVLEISINNGAFTDILAAGGSFVANGYNMTIDSSYGNPMGDRMAWSGFSDGFVTTVVNLPAAASGQNIQMRWRLGSDDDTGSDGWYIDTISVTEADCCVTVPNNLVVRISDSPDPIVAGGNLTYTINLFNTGPLPTAGLVLTDVLPDSFTFHSITVSPGTSGNAHVNSGGTITVNFGSLTGGASATITITGTADSVGTITNRVVVSRTDPDANPADNTATAVTTVILPSLSINDVTLLEGNSETTNALFRVSLFPPAFQTVTVYYSTSNLTAAAGSDYLNTSGTLMFAPGVTNMTIAVPIIGDRINEPDETFALYLSNPTNAVVEKNLGLGTIINDDPLPNLSVNDATVVNVNSMTTNAVFSVSLDPRSGRPVMVSYYTSDGTAVAGTDYLPFSSTLLNFAPGETNKTVSVPVQGHVTTKPAQTFYLHLEASSNAKIGRDRGLGTIITALPAYIDHLSWSAISSPQSNGAPFAVTLTARDYLDSQASNFSGTVALSGVALAGVRTNTVFGNMAHNHLANTGTYTIGNAFIPNADILVTHVRHYSGTKVSIWTDAGVLLASQNVTSVPGTWVETALPIPVPLSAGQRYRIGFYTAGNNYYGRDDQSSSFSDGTVDQTYFTSGDGFPNRPDTWRWIFVDVRYTASLLNSVPVTPTSTGNFTNGVWSGNVTAQQPTTNVTLRADDGFGHAGQSLSFEVAPVRGQLTHFAWSGIPSSLSNGAPFAVTLTAQDYFNETASNFAGTVALSGIGAVGVRTNTLLGTATPTDSSSGAYTLGYAFTPRTNLAITHVRHYFGNKVSIWTDAGVLLASRSFSSTPGTWVETPLITPIQLLAGNRYRIAAYTGGGNYYSRSDMAVALPDITIEQSYEVSGNVFPTVTDSARWWFVDLRYTVGLWGPVPVSPTGSGNFTNGLWSGNLAVFQVATNVTLRADDGLGHPGQSLPFNVGEARGQITHFAWSTIPSPQVIGEPFAVTLTAQDYLNSTASNFTGNVALSGSGVVGLRTNTMFGDISPSRTFNNGNIYTVGNAFTPNANILVTHLRHYFGTKVSIWTDGGSLLATRNVTDVPGTWVETPLLAPLQLSAGRTYRVGIYTGGNDYSWRNDQSSGFSDGTINQGYEIGGDAFPTTTDIMRWWLVDIRYIAGTVATVPVNPANSATFTDGIWSGNLVVLQAATNLTLRAEDDFGHLGLSLPFVVGGTPRLSIARSGNSVVLSWPAAATGFALEGASLPYFQTNWIPIVDPPSVMSGRNTISNSISGSNMIFRLKKS